MHISLLSLLADAVESLAFAERSESSDGQSLSLAALEKTAAVRSGKKTCLYPYRPDLFVSTVVRSDAVIEDEASDLFLGYLIKNVADLLFTLGEDLLEVLLGLDFYSVHVVEPFLLFFCVNSLAHLLCSELSYSLVDLFRNCLELDLLLRLSYLGYYIVDERDDLLDLFMCEHDGVEHLFFGNFISSGFNHHDGFFRAGYSKRNVARFSLRQIRVDDQFSVNAADDDRTCRTVPRDIRDGKRNARTDHCRELRRRIMVH